MLGTVLYKPLTKLAEAVGNTEQVHWVHVAIWALHLHVILHWHWPEVSRTLSKSGTRSAGLSGGTKEWPERPRSVIDWKRKDIIQGSCRDKQ